MNDNLVNAILEKLDKSELLVRRYRQSNSGNFVISKFLKFLQFPDKFLRNNAFKAGIIKNEKVYTQTFWGEKFQVPLNDVNAVLLYYCGSLGLSEGNLTRFFIRHIQPGDVFYDVGANYGYYSNLATWLLNGTGEVHSFEPNPSTMCFIRENNKEKQYPAVQLVEAAVSDYTGTLVFYDTSKGRKSGMSTTNPEVVQKNGLAYREISVPCLTLDEYMKTHKYPNIMKIDVESSEALVLLGAKNLLSAGSPLISMEVWDAPHVISRSEKALSLLNEAGYIPHKILPDGNIQKTEIRLGSLGDDNIFVFKKV